MNKKVTTVALAGLMAVSTGLSASSSRWNGLGLINTFVADVQDVWTLPTALLDNGDALYIELNALGGGFNAIGTGTAANTLAGAAGAWGGVHFGALGGQVGLWTGRGVGAGHLTAGQVGYGANALTVGSAAPGVGFAAADLTAGGAIAGQGLNPFVAPTSDIDLLWGMNVNDNTQVAVGINKSSGTAGNTLSRAAIAGVRDSFEESNTASGFGVSFGVGMSEVGPLSGLWAGVSFQSNNSESTSVSDGSVTATNKADGKDTRSLTDINLRVAGEAAGDDNMSQLFDLNVAIESNVDERTSSRDLSANGAFEAAETNTDKITNSAMDVALGWAISGSSDKGMAASGLILNFANGSNEQQAVIGGTAGATTKFETSTLGLAWAAGTEVKAKDYLTVRAGVSGDIFGTNSRKNTITPAAGTAIVDEANGHVPGGATASVGIGVAMGDVMIDGVLNQDFLYGGPYFLSGTEAGLNSQVSITYSWGGME